jgi:cell division septal protein FtsQ
MLMNRNPNNINSKTIPRVYDKRTGEYRPASTWDKQNEEIKKRKKRYATPQKRASIRKKRRRHAIILFNIFIFILAVVGAIVVSLTVLFKIDTIEVLGQSRYKAEDIIKIADIKKGENLFLANTKEAKNNILQKLPYIGEVKISRKLPAKMTIEVKSEPICGAVEYKGKYAIISENSKILEIANKIPNNCATIKGMEISKAEVGKNIIYKDKTKQENFTKLTAAIHNNKLNKITTINLTNPYKIEITYDGRIIMNLGIPSDLDYKIRFAKSILDEGKIKENEKGTLNLSVAAQDNQAYFAPVY